MTLGALDDLISASIAPVPGTGVDARLKKLVAERDLEIEVMKEVASKNW